MKPQNHDSISKRATRIRKLSQVSFPLLPHSTLVIRAGRTYLGTRFDARVRERKPLSSKQSSQHTCHYETIPILLMLDITFTPTNCKTLFTCLHVEILRSAA